MYGGGHVQPETNTSWPIHTGSGLKERNAQVGTFFGTTAEAGKQMLRVPDTKRTNTKAVTAISLVILFEFFTTDLVCIFLSLVSSHFVNHELYSQF
jgi:hypothetical protein